jgi:hypothetical protein
MHLPDRVDLVIVEFDTEDPQCVLTSAKSLMRTFL